jgi:hypothetical protein
LHPAEGDDDVRFYFFIGGVMHNAEALCAISNPVANSYKRINAPATLSGATWAPTYAVASFRGITNFVFKPPLRLARDVTVRTLDDAAEFARTYVGPRLPHRRDRIVRRLEEISDEASARVAARAFRAWAIAEGLLAEES